MKIKKDTLAIIIAVVLVFAYIFYQCYSVMHIDFETETAVLSTVYEKIDATALVVRDEHTISAKSSGVTVPCVSDGDKINVGGNVAMAFSSAEAAENYSKYLDIQKDLKYYENLQSQTVGQAANVESINTEIGENINNFVRAASNQNSEDIDEKAVELGDSILRRQMIIGKDVDLLSIIQNLRKEAQSFSSSKPESYITTKESGVFSSYTDSLESIVNYAKAEEMSVDDINSALKKVDESKEVNDGKYIGKIITSYAWYFECVVDSSKVINLEDGQKVQIALKDNDSTVLNVQIVSGAQPKTGQKKTALILKSSNMDSKIAALRKADIEIRTNSLEGIKVPASALHVSKDKKTNKERKGVYVLISSQVKFREAEVIYSDNDYVILSFDPDLPNGIRLYDQIITQGKELEDGKVYI